MLDVATRSYLIHDGRVVFRGNSEEFLRDPDVRRHYLGDRFDTAHSLEGPRKAPLASPEGVIHDDGAAE